MATFSGVNSPCERLDERTVGSKKQKRCSGRRRVVGVDRDLHISSTVCAAQPISGTAARHDLITRDKNLGRSKSWKGSRRNGTSSWRAVSLAALICADRSGRALGWKQLEGETRKKKACEPPLVITLKLSACCQLVACHFVSSASLSLLQFPSPLFAFLATYFLRPPSGSRCPRHPTFPLPALADRIRQLPVLLVVRGFC